MHTILSSTSMFPSGRRGGIAIVMRPRYQVTRPSWLLLWWRLFRLCFAAGLVAVFSYSWLVSCSLLMNALVDRFNYPNHNDFDMENNALLFHGINNQLMSMNRVEGLLQWKSLTGEYVDQQTIQESVQSRSAWRSKWCAVLMGQTDTKISRLTLSQERQVYLLCRGPQYTPDQVRELLMVLRKLQGLNANTTLCRGPHYPCYHIEPDLDKLMKLSQDPAELLWAWHGWRSAVGPPAKRLYPTLIKIQNAGAKNNGYEDIGECWREELQTEFLEEVVENLFLEIQELYRKLHGFVRFRLATVYDIDPTDLIPAHLLGSMWSQNWESLLPLLLNTTFDLDASFKVQGFTILNMMKIAEDFYMSLGLDPLPFRFWRYSQMNKPNGRTGFTCHGTSANMYTGDDYRMMMCAEGTFNDFRVIHHEMGHVQYYMAYKDQPTLFQAGANSAFHEAVGDSVMLGVMSPQHLLRLGILRPVHETPDLDIALLLRMALNKLPQLAFGLIMDKWRWAVMRGTIRPDEYNSAWWQLMEAYLGVVPPTTRTDYDFDPAAKYHILGNTPYIRYYLSGFLEMQFLESMCEAKLHDDNSDVEGPLHRCDIYGSSKAGMRLRRMMELGSSVQWSEALLVMTGGRYNFYSARPLLKYFRPLSKWLDLQISRHQIPVWSPESE